MGGDQQSTSDLRPAYTLGPPISANRRADAPRERATPAAPLSGPQPAQLSPPPAQPTLAAADSETPRQTAANTPTPARTEGAPRPAPSAVPQESASSLLAAGRQAAAAGELVAARTRFAEALQRNPAPDEAKLLRSELVRLGEETIFSPRILENDTLTERYIIQTGDSLAKIANRFKVSADLLAAVNGIADKNRIRAGQAIKVVHGPFRAVVDKRSYTLDLLLADVLVRQFPVGLGADGSTPTGQWQVSTKLVNPTYYPPRGGAIIAADDPKNPLGERWIGLVGLAGEALGQERYGIHGTIEPETIGRDASLGCIRLHNKDVESLYMCLVEKHSTVIVK